jgi:ketosteroid isomerase-like protein
MADGLEVDLIRNVIGTWLAIQNGPQVQGLMNIVMNEDASFLECYAV